MPRRTTRNDWRATHELYRRVIGVVSRGGSPDTIANEIHDTYLRHGNLPGPATPEIPRCRQHYMTALEGGCCPTCRWSPNEPGARPATRNDHRVTRELHQAVVAVISRGGNVDDIATQIHNVYRRNGWKAAGPAGLGVSRCREHKTTTLQNGRCPICQWSPQT